MGYHFHAARALLVAMALLTVGICLAPNAAEARMIYCNDRSIDIFAAIGVPDGGKLRAKGWFSIPSGTCKDVYQSELKQGTYYIYAKTARISSANSTGRYEWYFKKEHTYTLCTDSGSFDITDPFQCKDNGYFGLPFLGFCVTSPGSWAFVFRAKNDSVGVKLPSAKPGEKVITRHNGRCTNDPVPARPWVQRYGALAINYSTGSWSIRVATSQTRADNLALDNCYGSCRIATRLSRSCIALAQKRVSGGISLEYNLNTFREEARMKVLQTCGGGCTIEAVTCARDWR